MESFVVQFVGWQIGKVGSFVVEGHVLSHLEDAYVACLVVDIVAVEEHYYYPLGSEGWHLQNVVVQKVD